MDTPLSTFVLILLLFHISEVALVWRFERQSLSVRSLLLSPPYMLAMLLALVEYWLSLSLLYPRVKAALLKTSYWPGVVGIIIGESVRKTAWLTARDSFSHDVRTSYDPRQRLVTHGVYAWFRHPAYWGWFVWALSTQVLLANPLSFVLFTAVTWRFFRVRIPYEEAFLVRSFGDAYLHYRSVTSTRIPGIP